MSAIILFEEKQVRRAWDEAAGKWNFAIVDVIAVLTASVDAGAYWRKLKEGLNKDGNQTVTNCHALKMTAADGKQRLTDVADTEQFLRLIQSIPSTKAEPFKLWLARVGCERLEEIENPELAAKRMREIFLPHAPAASVLSSPTAYQVVVIRVRTDPDPRIPIGCLDSQSPMPACRTGSSICVWMKLARRTCSACRAKGPWKS